MLGYLILKGDAPFDFLFGHGIPARDLLIRLLYSTPGFLLAVFIGVVFNVLVYEALRRISKKVEQSWVITLLWIAVVVWACGFTKFTYHVAWYTGWYKVFYEAKGFDPGGKRLTEAATVDEKATSQFYRSTYGERRK